MKAAVIGCGRMGAQPSSRMEGTVPAGWLPISHVEALADSGRFSKLALCDSNRESVEKWGRHYGIEDVFVDYREMVRAFRPDVVTIATRTPIKKEIIEFLCANGVKGLYVEKPLATSIADARALIDLIERSGVKIAYGVNRRYHAAYRKALAMLEERAIGDVLEIDIEHGPSQLLWTHPHSVDLLLLFAKVASDDFSVQATLKSETVQRKSDKVVDSDPVVEHAHFRFSNGITANIGRGIGLNVRIHGTEGSLVIHGNGTFLELLKKENAKSPYFLGRKIVVPEPKTSASVVAMTELADALESKADALMRPATIATGIEMLMGTVWSHLNDGRRITAREIPADLCVTGRSGDLYA